MLSHTAPTTTEREDFVTVVLGAWLIIGLFLDGFAHSEILEGTEGFITPWHAVFYSGFLATAAWIARLVGRNLSRGVREAIPRGYRLAVVGLAVFAAGGIGDAIWHTLFGIETSLDALLSPTHLLLYVGMMLIVTTPLRSRRPDAPGSSTWSSFRAPFISSLLATSLAAFFFVYLWAPVEPRWFRHLYDPVTDAGEVYVTAGIGAVLVSTAVLTAPLAVVVRRWTPPFGFATVLWPVVNLLVAVAFDRRLVGVVAGLLGGLAFDLVARAVRGRLAGAAAGLAGALVLWSVFFWQIGSTEPIAWQTELWVGAIVFGGLTGLAVMLLGADSPTPSIGSRGAR